MKHKGDWLPVKYVDATLTTKDVADCCSVLKGEQRKSYLRLQRLADVSTTRGILFFSRQKYLIKDYRLCPPSHETSKDHRKPITKGSDNGKDIKKVDNVLWTTIRTEVSLTFLFGISDKSALMDYRLKYKVHYLIIKH